MWSVVDQKVVVWCLTAYTLAPTVFMNKSEAPNESKYVSFLKTVNLCETQRTLNSMGLHYVGLLYKNFLQ